MYNKSNIYVLLSLSFWAGVIKILQTRWFKQHLFLTVLEGGKSKIKALTNLVLVRPTSWFIDSWLLTMSSHGGRGKRTLWHLFSKGTNPIHEDSAFMTWSPPMGPLSKSIILGLGFNIWILEKHKHSVHSILHSISFHHSERFQHSCC